MGIFKRELQHLQRNCAVFDEPKNNYMKALIIIVLIVAAACNGNQGTNKSIQTFIPGTYVRHYEGEYSKGGGDTLTINEVNGGAKVYSIVRHVSYQRIIDKKVQPREYKTENWKGIYNEKDKILHEQKRGVIISFNPEKKTLMVGSDEYQKIK